MFFHFISKQFTGIMKAGRSSLRIFNLYINIELLLLKTNFMQNIRKLISIIKINILFNGMFKYNYIVVSNKEKYLKEDFKSGLGGNQ